MTDRTAALAEALHDNSEAIDAYPWIDASEEERQEFLSYAASLLASLDTAGWTMVPKAEIARLRKFEEAARRADSYLSTYRARARAVQAARGALRDALKAE